MIHFSGTGPQKRLSSEDPRLSPIMKYIPAGIAISVGKSPPSPPPPGYATGPFCARAVGRAQRLVLELAGELGPAVVDPELVARAGHDALDEVDVRAVGGRLV